jgi:hypothetical protein
MKHDDYTRRKLIRKAARPSVCEKPPNTYYKPYFDRPGMCLSFKNETLIHTNFADISLSHIKSLFQQARPAKLVVICANVAVGAPDAICPAYVVYGTNYDAAQKVQKTEPLQSSRHILHKNCTRHILKLK